MGEASRTGIAEIRSYCETDAIREVIAFPKTAKAACLMSDCPSEVNRDQLVEVGVRLTAQAEKLIEDGKKKHCLTV